MYGLQGPTKQNISTAPFETIHFPAQMKQNLHTQQGVTYAQITKQNSYAATNIQLDQHINQPHQQTSNIQNLKDMMKGLFGQMGTTIKLTTVLANPNNG
jgi:hypothetical protein